MSEQHPPTSPQEPSTLERRVAAIEDRLAQLTVTEEEMKAYQKVAALMTGRTVAAGPLATHVSPIASTETTGGPALSIPAFVHPHLPTGLQSPVPFPTVPAVNFPTLPVINIALIGGFATPFISNMPLVVGQPLAGGVGFPQLGQ